MENKLTNGVMLNAYPDSLGNNLGDVVDLLNRDELRNIFDSFYILPSVFNSDLDRGFSVIDYGLNEEYANVIDIENLKKLGINLKFDFVLNHLSVQSPQFQDIIKRGEKSEFQDFFINWNKFWEGKGEIKEDGVLHPDDKYIKDMFFRKASLPVLSVRYPNGEEVPYWNTFYQEINYPLITPEELVSKLDIEKDDSEKLANLVNTGICSGVKPSEITLESYENIKSDLVNLLESKRKYLGQMDLNIASPKVWKFYRETLEKLSNYGASIVRLDAFAYSSKKVGKKNFFNLPETWDDLEKVRQLANDYGLELLPEIHSMYKEKLHEEISSRGFLTYDFFLPGLVIDALERNTNEKLLEWIHDVQEKELKVVNMLGCHDGIPLLDLKGLLSDEEIQNLIDIVVSRGGHVKDLKGKTNIYYQVNATYYSALGEDDKKMKLARAIQIFMPGKPQVWYLDLFAGKNDYEALAKGGTGGHKEINRTNLSLLDIEERLQEDVVQEQLRLLKFRNTSKAFGFDAKLTIVNEQKHLLKLIWENNGEKATLDANLEDYTYNITVENLD